VLYELKNNVMQAVRLAPEYFIDALSIDAARLDVVHEAYGRRFFTTRGRLSNPGLNVSKPVPWTRHWTNCPALLISDHVHTVNAAIDELVRRIRLKQNPQESLRLLYAGLYYWYHPNKGISRSVCLRISKILEDLLTERPPFFPTARINRSFFRGESPTVRIHFSKPARISLKHIQARIQWSVNGRRKKPMTMALDKQASTGEKTVLRSSSARQKRMDSLLLRPDVL
jgi:hypothetical protein